MSNLDVPQSDIEKREYEMENDVTFDANVPEEQLIESGIRRAVTKERAISFAGRCVDALRSEQRGSREKEEWVFFRDIWKKVAEKLSNNSEEK